ncbi:hypothetical protein RNJ44_03749 [Nakaseomyces bracarensis]|uniref:Uncharacterized protein n=1 Tax=Nakaseomyces bracarensis TaxID=273131 RepID=A0ABR4NY11_9SACH
MDVDKEFAENYEFASLPGSKSISNSRDQLATNADIEPQLRDGRNLRIHRLKSIIMWPWNRGFFFTRRLLAWFIQERKGRKYKVIVMILMLMLSFLLIFTFRSETIQAISENIANISGTYDTDGLDTGPYEAGKDSGIVASNQNCSGKGIECLEILKEWDNIKAKIRELRPRVKYKNELGDFDTAPLIDMQSPEFLACGGSSCKNRIFELSKLTNYQSNVNLEINMNISEQCKNSKYHHDIFFSHETIPLNDDLLAARANLVKKDPKLKELLDDIAESSGKTIEESVRDQWLRFGSSAQWFEDYQCYLVFSRIIVSRAGSKGIPTVSLIGAQAYDRNWNEILGKRIPYLDIQIPENFEEQLQGIENKYKLDEYCIGTEDETALIECEKEVEVIRRSMEDEKNSLISKYYMVYPQIVNIPFPVSKKNAIDGPEDPKISIRENKDGRKEPLVFFNMNSDVYGRVMHCFMPQRSLRSVTHLTDVVGKVDRIQKNWSPFFHDEDGASELSRGSVHLIHNTSPAKVVRCSLDDGFCTAVFDSRETLGKTKYESTLIRGGAAFVKLPAVIPALEGRKLWVGLSKPHLYSCGISDAYYRTALNVLEEIDGKYYFSLFTEPIDFNRTVRGWRKEREDAASGVNIRSPNSIISWDVVGQDKDTKEYEDYMQISLSEADELSYVFVLKGVMNYLIKSFKENDVEDVLDWTSTDIIPRSQRAGFCFIDDMFEKCEKYTELHPDPIEEESRRKQKEYAKQEAERKKKEKEEKIKQYEESLRLEEQKNKANMHTTL